MSDFTMMDRTNLHQWADRIAGTGDLTLESGKLLGLKAGSFCDELTHQRAVDLPLLVCLGASGDVPPTPTSGSDLDERLWWACAAGSSDVAFDGSGDGSLVDPSACSTIEVWTETEFCALHALGTLARVHDRSDWRDRVQRAVRWHVAETQPDNATNTPWAIHLFAQGGTGECDLFAQTLLHNSIVSLGRPDLRSSLVLHHAASELRHALTN